MKTVVRGVLAAVLLVFAVGCSDDSEATEESGPDAKVAVELGEEFTWNDFTVTQGWALETTTQMIELEERDQPFITGEVTNDADEARFPLFEFAFVGDGELQTSIRCTSVIELEPGEAGPLECPGFGRTVPKGYDLIQVQAITR